MLLGLALRAAPASSQPHYEPGRSYFGHSNYVEYIPGDLPLVISAPHGGTWAPNELPDRATGEFTSDSETEALARTIHQAFLEQLGHSPHVIVSRLERAKLDCNRPIAEGAGQHPAARQAWEDYHGFIAVARGDVLARTGRGFYIDLHGQSHPIARIELGYCLSDTQLTNTDKVLNRTRYANSSTIRTLAHRSRLPFSQLLRGTNSLGALLAANGYPAIPSPSMPNPGPGNSYFDGGYNARHYGSLKGGAIDGVQMEVNYIGLRDSPANRTNFSIAFARVMNQFFKIHYGFDLDANTVRTTRN